MCTVTYVPLDHGQYVITHNRDEIPQRASTALQKSVVNDVTVLYPADATRGGSWIGCQSRGRAGFVINGALEGHIRKPPYRMSRGLLLLEMLRSNTMHAFVENTDFKGIEPFRMISCDQSGLEEIIWNGSALQKVVHDPSQPHIWASWTLYNAYWQSRRKSWFADWLKENPLAEPTAIEAFHQVRGEGFPDNSLCMERSGGVRTLSVSQIFCKDDAFVLSVNRLLESTSLQKELVLQP